MDEWPSAATEACLLPFWGSTLLSSRESVWYITSKMLWALRVWHVSVTLCHLLALQANFMLPSLFGGQDWKQGVALFLQTPSHTSEKNKRHPNQIERSEICHGCICQSVRCHCCDDASVLYTWLSFLGKTKDDLKCVSNHNIVLKQDPAVSDRISMYKTDQSVNSSH